MKQTYTDEELDLAIANHEKAIALLEEIESGKEFYLALVELRHRLSVLEGMRQSRRSG